MGAKIEMLGWGEGGVSPSPPEDGFEGAIPEIFLTFLLLE